MKTEDDYGLFGNDNQGNKSFDDMDENIPKDFSSVEKLVKLPNMRELQPNENIFPPVEDELVNSPNISEGLKQTMISLREGLNKQFKTFGDSKNFHITFPESLFPPVQPGKRNLISYEQKNIVQDEDTFRDKLSAEQIGQIAQNGEFKVKSNHQYITLPYMWKINESLFRGKKNIELSWMKGVARAHSYLAWAKKLYSTQIPNELRKISKLPLRLFSLFFGKRSMRSTNSTDFNREIAKDFWNEVMEKYYVRSQEWGSYLFEYLDNGYKAEDHVTIFCDDLSNKDKKQLYEQKLKQQRISRDKYNSHVKQNNSKKDKIILIGDDFERKWSKSKKKVFQQVSRKYQQQQAFKKKEQTLEVEVSGSEDKLIVEDKQKVDEENLLQRLNDKKFSLYTQFLQKKLPEISVPNTVISSLVTLLTIIQLITSKQRNLSSKLSKQKARVQKAIKQQHKILQHDYSWYNQEVERRYKPIEQRIKWEYYNKFVDEDVKLAAKLGEKQKQTYVLWLQYRQKYDSYVQAKRRQYPETQQPTRTFYSTYQLLPPYKVIAHTEGNNRQWYEMVKIRHLQISTDKNFWKVRLYLMRVKSWTINCVVFLIYCCWKGTFGLRCLWGTSEFTYNQSISHDTGLITHKMRKPFLVVFKTVLQGVNKSRQHFESLPDRGLFGKNFSRYFNYAECYIFRLLIVGVMLTLIIYPIAIIIQSLVMFILILTVWVWMPLVLLITYLFNTIIFQFESSYIPYGFFIRAAPVLSLVLSLGKSMVIILWIVLFTVVIAPGIAVGVGVWTLTCRVCRTVTDFMMLFFISKLGRTPSRNTAIAKKISGPGMSKQYYMSINEQDVYILIQSQLQQIFMRQFNRIWMQQINKPIDSFNDVMKMLLAPFMQNQYYNQYTNSQLINGSVNQLRNLYSKHYQQYMNRYPNRPQNIRFTQEQIDSYFENTVKIVQNFVYKKYIQSWIFDQNHVLQGDYEELTRKLWMITFNCGQEIFQPLEKIDQRFKLQDMYKDTYDYDESSSTGYSSKNLYGGSMKKNVGKVMQALEGEVQLKPRRAKIAGYKHNLLHREWSSTGVREVITNINNNSDNSVCFSTYETKFIFYPNLSIKEVIKKDNHQFELKNKKQNNNNYPLLLD